MENAYAQALWIAIEKGAKPEDAVRGLHQALKAEGREALLPRIGSAFARIAKRHQNRDQIALTVADKAHVHSARDAVLASKPGLDASDVEIHVDPTLIGGWRLEGREELVDASYKKHLLALYRNVAQNV